MMKCNVLDSSFFLGKNFFGDDGFQNMFVYQPKPDALGKN